MADATGVCYTQSGNVKRYESSFGPKLGMLRNGLFGPITSDEIRLQHLYGSEGSSAYGYKIYSYTNEYEISKIPIEDVEDKTNGLVTVYGNTYCYFDYKKNKRNITLKIIFYNCIGSKKNGDAAYWVNISIGKHKGLVYHNDQSDYGVNDRNNWDGIEISTLPDYSYSFSNNGLNNTITFTISLDDSEFTNNLIDISVTEGHVCENFENTTTDYYLNRVIKLNGGERDQDEVTEPYKKSSKIYYSNTNYKIENDIEDISLTKTFNPYRYSGVGTEFNDHDLDITNNSNNDDQFFKNTFINYINTVSLYIDLLKKEVKLNGLSFSINGIWEYSGVSTDYYQKIIYGGNNYINSNVGVLPLYTNEDYFDYLSVQQFDELSETTDYGDVSSIEYNETEIITSDYGYKLVDRDGDKVNANVNLTMNVKDMDGDFIVNFKNGLTI